LNLLLQSRVSASAEVDAELLLRGLSDLSLPSRTRISLLQTVQEYRDGRAPSIWQQDDFGNVARMLVDALGCRQEVVRIIQEASDYAQLGTQLANMLERHVGTVSAELALAAEQCVMKDFSMQQEGNVEIYSMWRAHHEKGNVQ